MQQNNQPAEGSRFELWMVANLAVGMGQFVFVPLLAGLSMLVFYTGEPFGRIPQSVLAVRFSTLPTSTATGWYIAVLAGSASIGGLLAGVLAQTFGYSAILWMAAASFATGLLVNVFGLWPAERKIRAEEAREGAVSTGEVAPALE